jgi:MFS superfamily sulfate permease-like transporter
VSELACTVDVRVCARADSRRFMIGLAFFLLGYLRLGAFIEFFPRVVLVGCIGGVGAFLIITGVEVCAGLENEHLEFSWQLVQRFFEAKLFVLWVSLPFSAKHFHSQKTKR